MKSFKTKTGMLILAAVIAQTTVHASENGISPSKSEQSSSLERLDSKDTDSEKAQIDRLKKHLDQVLNRLDRIR